MQMQLAMRPYAGCRKNKYQETNVSANWVLNYLGKLIGIATIQL